MVSIDNRVLIYNADEFNCVKNGYAFTTRRTLPNNKVTYIDLIQYRYKGKDRQIAKWRFDEWKKTGRKPTRRRKICLLGRNYSSELEAIKNSRETFKGSRKWFYYWGGKKKIIDDKVKNWVIDNEMLPNGKSFKVLQFITCKTEKEAMDKGFNIKNFSKAGHPEAPIIQIRYFWDDKWKTITLKRYMLLREGINIPERARISHKDGNYKNCNVENLRY